MEDQIYQYDGWPYDNWPANCNIRQIVSLGRLQIQPSHLSVGL